MIGVYGLTASGKTTVARELAAKLRCESIHCGERIRSRAQALGVNILSLPDSEHQALDEETRLMSRNANGLFVVDGSFLDAVLASTSDLVLVRMECEFGERTRRYVRRDPAASEADVASRDASDAAFRTRLYSGPVASPTLVLDTTQTDVEACAASILAFISRVHAP